MLRLLGAGALDGNNKKVANMFLEDLQRAAEDGACGLRLHTAVYMIGTFVEKDVQFNEGTNSMVKQATSIAPSLSLPLLSARVTLRRS
eukprot:12056014-Alexandrium_andersonii.AAC.1